VLDSCAVFFCKLIFFPLFFNQMKSIVIFISLIYFPCTGSADRTVKFWDLETFELIGSAGPEVLSVTAILLLSPG